MRRLSLLALALFLGLPAAVGAQATPSAKEIVAGVDAVRNPGQPFSATTTITEYVGGKPRDQDVLVVYSKTDPASGQFRNVVRYLQPPRDAGKAVLLDGASLWFYDPASKASVRISPQQRLLGQASIADVLTVNLVLDYEPTLLGTDDILDADRHPCSCWHLDLKASSDRASYNRVELWVEPGTNRPLRGKFYADSGRLLKTLYYRDFQPTLGAVRPLEAIVIDAVDTTLVTGITFADYRFREIPEAWFQREYLPRLRAD